MLISIIAAVGKNRVIGHKNTLPWHLPADFAHFRELTLGKPIVMGQKTFESIGKPLPGRKNIVISDNQNFNPEGVTVTRSLEEAEKAAELFYAPEVFPNGPEAPRALRAQEPEVMICGGALIYKQFLPRADKMYLTLIHAEFGGDAYFPEWNPDEWQEISRKDHQADEKNSVDYSFITLERKTIINKSFHLSASH